VRNIDTNSDGRLVVDGYPNHAKTIENKSDRCNGAERQAYPHTPNGKSNNKNESWRQQAPNDLVAWHIQQVQPNASAKVVRRNIL
jgi:hypothetical protein